MCLGLEQEVNVPLLSKVNELLLLIWVDLWLEADEGRPIGVLPQSVNRVIHSPRLLTRLLKGANYMMLIIIFITIIIIIIIIISSSIIMSPLLFKLYVERTKRKAEMEEAKEGVKIAGRSLNNLRSADHTTLMAWKKVDLTKLIGRLKRESEEEGLYFNIWKTKNRLNQILNQI